MLCTDRRTDNAVHRQTDRQTDSIVYRRSDGRVDVVHVYRQKGGLINDVQADGHTSDNAE